MIRSCLLSLSLGFVGISVNAFSSSPLFIPERVNTKTKAPKSDEGVSAGSGIEVELPDFDELFGRIEQVSPLAKLALQGRDGGFFAMDDTSPGMKWKTVESNKNRVVHHIDKIENYQNLQAPLLRFRSSLKGPCIGEAFATFIMDLEYRKKWDVQIAQVDKIYPVHDLDDINNRFMGKYGEFIDLGIGYCQTKPNLVATSREQLTICGIQNFRETGATVIWGTEMEEKYDHLLPPGERFTRARTHLFSTALVPSGPDTFDVEYVLQLDSGGRIPSWMITPVISETVKSMFRYAKDFYEGGPELDAYLKAKKEAEEIKRATMREF